MTFWARITLPAPAKFRLVGIAGSNFADDAHGSMTERGAQVALFRN